MVPQPITHKHLFRIPACFFAQIAFFEKLQKDCLFVWKKLKTTGQALIDIAYPDDREALERGLKVKVFDSTLSFQNNYL